MSSDLFELISHVALEGHLEDLGRDIRVRQRLRPRGIRHVEDNVAGPAKAHLDQEARVGHADAIGAQIGRAGSELALLRSVIAPDDPLGLGLQFIIEPVHLVEVLGTADRVSPFDRSFRHPVLPLQLRGALLPHRLPPLADVALGLLGLGQRLRAFQPAARRLRSVTGVFIQALGSFEQRRPLGRVLIQALRSL